MTPAEKIYSEDRENRSVIILRPEDMFYRAYEHSAYLVCKSIREFKPMKRFYKNIGQEIVSIVKRTPASFRRRQDTGLP